MTTVNITPETYRVRFENGMTYPYPRNRIVKRVDQQGIYRHGDRVVASETTYQNGVRPVDPDVVYPEDQVFRVSFSANEVYPNDYGHPESPTFNLGDWIHVVRASDWLHYEGDHLPYQADQLVHMTLSTSASDWADAAIHASSPYYDNRIYSVELHYHKYKYIWAQVKDWKSDDGTRTGEVYYKLITEAPGFCEVRYLAETYIFGETEAYIQNTWCECPEKPDIDFAKFKAFLFQYEFHHKSGKWALRIQHKTDRDGPCNTCRDLMQHTPVDVGGILL